MLAQQLSSIPEIKSRLVPVISAVNALPAESVFGVYSTSVMLGFAVPKSKDCLESVSFPVLSVRNSSNFPLAAE